MKREYPREICTLSSLELLHLSSASNTTIETGEGDGLLVLLHIIEIGICLLQPQT